MTWGIHVLCSIFKLTDLFFLIKCIHFPSLTGLDKFQMLMIQVHEFDPYQPLLKRYIILKQVPFVERQFSVVIFTFLYDVGFLSREYWQV